MPCRHRNKQPRCPQAMGTRVVLGPAGVERVVLKKIRGGFGGGFWPFYICKADFGFFVVMSGGWAGVRFAPILRQTDNETWTGDVTRDKRGQRGALRKLGSFSRNVSWVSMIRDACPLQSIFLGANVWRWYRPRCGTRTKWVLIEPGA